MELNVRNVRVRYEILSTSYLSPGENMTRNSSIVATDLPSGQLVKMSLEATITMKVMVTSYGHTKGEAFNNAAKMVEKLIPSSRKIFQLRFSD